MEKEKECSKKGRKWSVLVSLGETKRVLDNLTSKEADELAIHINMGEARAVKTCERYYVEDVVLMNGRVVDMEKLKPLGNGLYEYYGSKVDELLLTHTQSFVSERFLRGMMGDIDEL